MSLLSQVELERRAAALRERLSAPPATSWRPDKRGSDHPRELVGIFIRTEKGLDHGYGEGSCAVVRTLEGLEWKVWFKTALEQQWQRLQVVEGNLVAVRYEGYVDARDGRPGYHAYRLEVDKAPGATAAGLVACDQCSYRDGQHASDCPCNEDAIPF